MCESMADIQSPTTEIRQIKKRRKIETTGQKYNGLPYYIGQTIITTKICNSWADNYRLQASAECTALQASLDWTALERECHRSQSETASSGNCLRSWVRTCWDSALHRKHNTAQTVSNNNDGETNVGLS